MTVKRFLKGLSYMFSQFSLKTKIASILFIVMLGLYLIGWISEPSHVEYKVASHETVTHTSKKPTTYFDAMTPAQHLSLAKKDLLDYIPNKDITKAYWGPVSDARKQLEAIKPGGAEYREAQTLMKEVLKREKVMAKASRLKKRRNKNRLQQLVQNTVYHGQPFIKSYTISQGSAHIQLNPGLWNSMRPAQQRQICDMLAGTDVWKKMGLLNAYLYVYRTNIGRIGPTWSGGFEFKPALRSLE